MEVPSKEAEAAVSLPTEPEDDASALEAVDNEEVPTSESRFPIPEAEALLAEFCSEKEAPVSVWVRLPVSVEETEEISLSVDDSKDEDEEAAELTGAVTAIPTIVPSALRGPKSAKRGAAEGDRYVYWSVTGMPASHRRAHASVVVPSSDPSCARGFMERIAKP